MKNKKIIDNDEIKAVLLELLRKFDFICRKHNLKYSLCGGTLLGAIRHKGFIPWDDDVDVFMLRDEYIKFCKVFNKEKQGKNIELLNYYRKGYYATFAKIVDTRTYSMENKRIERLGVWIDLHIIDLMPSKELTFYSDIIKNVKEIRYLGSIKYLSICNNCFSKFKAKIVRCFKKIALRKKIESFLSKNSGSEEVSFSFGDKVGFWCKLPNLHFYNLVDLDFENLKVMCIKSYDIYLAGKYGDYMTIPKPEDRIMHDVKCFIWK